MLTFVIINSSEKRNHNKPNHIPRIQQVKLKVYAWIHSAA